MPSSETTYAAFLQLPASSVNSPIIDGLTGAEKCYFSRTRNAVVFLRLKIVSERS
jgi:hypothetical protein